MLKVNRDLKIQLKTDRWEIIVKDEQMCTVLNDYFLSVLTKKDVESVLLPQQMCQGTEKDKLLDIIIKQDMVQKK